MGDQRVLHGRRRQRRPPARARGRAAGRRARGSAGVRAPGGAGRRRAPPRRPPRRTRASHTPSRPRTAFSTARAGRRLTADHLARSVPRTRVGCAAMYVAECFTIIWSETNRSEPAEAKWPTTTTGMPGWKSCGRRAGVVDGHALPAARDGEVGALARCARRCRPPPCPPAGRWWCPRVGLLGQRLVDGVEVVERAAQPLHQQEGQRGRPARRRPRPAGPGAGAWGGRRGGRAGRRGPGGAHRPPSATDSPVPARPARWDRPPPCAPPPGRAAPAAAQEPAGVAGEAPTGR